MTRDHEDAREQLQDEVEDDARRAFDAGCSYAEVEDAVKRGAFNAWRRSASRTPGTDA